MAVGRVPPFVPPPGQNIEREEVGVLVVRAQDKRTPKRGPEPAGIRSSLGSEPKRRHHDALRSRKHC
ncbi:hypothetical protein ACFX2B_026757 [Malus domestica]